MKQRLKDRHGPGDIKKMRETDGGRSASFRTYTVHVFLQMSNLQLKDALEAPHCLSYPTLINALYNCAILHWGKTATALSIRLIREH